MGLHVYNYDFKLFYYYSEVRTHNYILPDKLIFMGLLLYIIMYIIG